ncbi:MAG TPA: 2Fe-2S iron-sulfur cluster-binding protein, partial [Bacteroidales bacterium]|nr:2Fe-2S iron-sulfur cluster-binding protein [Bacteroidales bacterium]
MISFVLNGVKRIFLGDGEESLLDHLRIENMITSHKDGCSGQGVCGACTVEINGKARMACRTKMKNLEGAVVVTAGGLPEKFRTIISRKFAEKGAVQCGFCSPGMVMRAKALYNTNKKPSRKEIIAAITPNLCRCTGYVKIVDAIEAAFSEMRGSKTGKPQASALIGEPYPKYMAAETALGNRDFVDDIWFEGMVYGALKFSDHPRARVISIDTTEARQSEGVIRVFTARDIPGAHKTGLIFKDWPLMIGEGEIIHYMGDVVAGV